jgi:hypothetical protein
LLLALVIGGPAASRTDPGETAPLVPTYASPPYFMDRALRERTGRWVVVVKGPGGREVRHPRVFLEQADGWTFEIRVVRHADSGKHGLQVKDVVRGQ